MLVRVAPACHADPHVGTAGHVNNDTSITEGGEGRIDVLLQLILHTSEPQQLEVALNILNRRAHRSIALHKRPLRSLIPLRKCVELLLPPLVSSAGHHTREKRRGGKEARKRCEEKTRGEEASKGG
jgi:hypothetical protein